MRHVIFCGARNRSGGCCRRICAPGRTRCYRHGGLQTGPRSLAARVAAGERLRVYRVNGAPGVPKGHKKADRRQRAIENRKLVAERQERKRERLRVKAQLDRVAAGLPAWTEAELDKLE
jgi:hypothetical protein